MSRRTRIEPAMPATVKKLRCAVYSRVSTVGRGSVSDTGKNLARTETARKPAFKLDLNAAGGPCGFAGGSGQNELFRSIPIETGQNIERVPDIPDREMSGSEANDDKGFAEWEGAAP